MARMYIDFDITFQQRSEAGYPFTATSSSGEARGFLPYIAGMPEHTILAARLARNEISEADLTRLGIILFEGLFQGSARDLLLHTQATLIADQVLRLSLVIHPDDRELVALSWELLFDPENGPLALSPISIVRRLTQISPTAILRTDSLPHILLTAAQTEPHTDVVRELVIAQAALADLEKRGLIRITVEPHLTPDRLQTLLRQKPQIWHFVGHGGVDLSQTTSQLMLEDAQGDLYRMPAHQLAALLRGSSLQLVVLHACQVSTLLDDPLRSLGPALIRAHIPAVIGAQFPVAAESTRAFTQAFYRTLAERQSLDECMLEGRRAVMNAVGISQPDWGLPTLMTRARDLRLFETSHIEQPTLPIRTASATRRIFISYKRNTLIDEPLAHQLLDALTQAGHIVFIDKTMQVGVAWAKEIQQQIERSDYLIVLLSSASIQSEMVAREVDFAARLTERNGQARLLPVRLDLRGPLPYQLSSALDQLHYAEWSSADDTPRLVHQLLDVLDGQEPLPLNPAGSAGLPFSLLDGPPAPYADPRFIDQIQEPGGGMRSHSEFYLERSADQRLQRELGRDEGVTVTIRAPRQCGKTSLLIRGAELARIDGRRVVSLDLQKVEKHQLADLDTFLQYLMRVIVKPLQIDQAEVDQMWASKIGASDKATYLFEDVILPQINGKLVLAIDEADHLLSAPFHNTFFGLLRSWHNSRAMNVLWDRLDILMVISTEPHLLISDVTQSPFNVGVRIQLDDFDRAQIADLSRRYRIVLRDTDLGALHTFLGGHPYLTSKALYTLVTEQISMTELAHAAITSHSPFHDHLRRYQWLLRDQPALRDALRQIILNGTCLNEMSFYRLMQAGLVVGNDHRACRPRCRLYADYLRDKL